MRHFQALIHSDRCRTTGRGVFKKDEIQSSVQNPDARIAIRVWHDELLGKDVYEVFTQQTGVPSYASRWSQDTGKPKTLLASGVLE